MKTDIMFYLLADMVVFAGLVQSIEFVRTTSASKRERGDGSERRYGVKASKSRQGRV
ncbi:hypothetical protein K523DRAFT_52030 [Schizophyllum commune Tattone D]|nr:hypothetical protein K523DRAFT_52030 [Schizophyllum commune Tattone D]